MFAVRAKIYGVPALWLLMKHLVIGQRQKALNFSAFHWLPHGNLVSFGQLSTQFRTGYTSESVVTYMSVSGCIFKYRKTNKSVMHRTPKSFFFPLYKLPGLGQPEQVW